MLISFEINCIIFFVEIAPNVCSANIVCVFYKIYMLFTTQRVSIASGPSCARRR